MTSQKTAAKETIPLRAIFKTRNGESGNGNGERGTGNL